MLRSILGIKIIDKITLGKIYEKTKAKKIRAVARTLKFKYAGHIFHINLMGSTIVAKGGGGDPAQDGQMN